MMPQPQPEQQNDPTDVTALIESPSVLDIPANELTPVFSALDLPLTPTSELVYQATFTTNTPPANEPTTALVKEAPPEAGNLPDDEGSRTKTIKVPVETIRQIDRRILGTEHTFHSFCLNLIVNYDTLLAANARAVDLAEELDRTRASLRKALDRSRESNDLEERAATAEREALRLQAENIQLKAQLNRATIHATPTPPAPEKAPSMSLDDEAKAQALTLILNQVKQQITDLLGEFDRVSNAGEPLAEAQFQLLQTQHAAAIVLAVKERDAAYYSVLDEMCRYAAVHAGQVNRYTKQYFLNYLALLLKPLVYADPK